MIATYVILMGMQGAGKGTQAEILTAQSGLPHVTSGGMFRAIMNQDTPLGKQIASIYNAGNLIPDDLTIQMIGARLREPDAVQGVILDGFPRTVPQAEALDKLPDFKRRLEWFIDNRPDLTRNLACIGH